MFAWIKVFVVVALRRTSRNEKFECYSSAFCQLLSLPTAVCLRSRRIFVFLATTWSDWIFWFKIRCTDVNKIFTPSKLGWQLRIRQICRQTQLAVKGEAFSAFCSIVSLCREKVSKERDLLGSEAFFLAVSISFFVIIFGDKSRAEKVPTSNP